ncbi:MAG: phosphopantetheine adenylyltransferase [Chloroflexota bacterium]
MKTTITILLMIIAIIHALPLSGFFGSRRLENLYGIKINDNNLEILMRHRAVLFGLLAAIFGYAAFVPVVQPFAFITAFFSITSFSYLAFSVSEYNNAIQKVVYADIVAAVCLVLAIVLYIIGR